MHRTFTCFFLCWMAGVGPALAASTGTSAAEDRELFERSQAIINGAARRHLDEFLGSPNPYTGKFDHVVRTLIEDTARATQDARRQADAPVPDIYVFLSLSLGDSVLKTIFADLAAHPNAIGVLRGIPKGAKLQTGLLHVQQIASQFEPPPRIVLDPRKFREFGIDSVPTIATELPDGKVKVRGLANLDWFLEQLAQGKAGDLGVRGELREISEPDLIELMKARLAKIDLRRQARVTVETFWSRVLFYDLEETVTYRRRVIDPTVVGTRDLATPNGKVFFRAGERVNPLELIPFTHRMLVFDATQADHLRLVNEQLGQLPDFQRVILIATRLPREEGWDELKALERQLGHPVYLLTPDLRERFQLEYAPAVVYADNEHKVFVVEEIPSKQTTIRETDATITPVQNPATALPLQTSEL